MNISTLCTANAEITTGVCDAKRIRRTHRQPKNRRLTILDVAAPDRFSGASPSDVVFVDESGERIPVMPVDFGFRSGGSRLYTEDHGTIPSNAFAMAIDNFKKEYRAIRRAIRFDRFFKPFEPKPIAEVSLDHPGKIKLFGGAIRSAMASVDEYLVDKDIFPELKLPRDVVDPQLSPEQYDVLSRLNKLTLDVQQIEERAKEREAREGKVEAPTYIKFSYKFLCWVLDAIYEGRPIQRFWFLETVARMPYFSYISMLHLYESLGWWRAGAELRKVHFAEEWNELHHLQIMESLGGDQLWIDRFMAQHAAIFYYWLLLTVYVFSPAGSYAFSELIEGHAVDTYGQFAEENKDILQTIPPPLVALNYYKAGDLYMFDRFQTAWKGGELRRPKCNNLYDVFVNIRDDEGEHVKTMHACKGNTIVLDLDGNDQMKEAIMSVRSLTSIDFADEE